MRITGAPRTLNIVAIIPTEIKMTTRNGFWTRSREEIWPEFPPTPSEGTCRVGSTPGGEETMSVNGRECVARTERSESGVKEGEDG